MEEVKAHKVVRRPASATCRESEGFAPVVPVGRWFGIVLPGGARADQVKTELQDGVLTVSVPVPQAAENEQAPIKEESKVAPAKA